MRRETFVADAPFSKEALLERFAADPRHETRLLVCRAGASAFAPLREGEVAPGDEVIFYAFDPHEEHDLLAVNASFSSDYYVASYDPPWPDEERVIREFVPESGAQVLEICCGAGRLAPTLVREGNRVTAVDNSIACLEHAKKRDGARVRYLAGDALSLPFADRSFDVACVFENSLGMLFAGKTRALEELLRVARTHVILGLREDGGDAERIQTYYSIDGYMEVGQTFTMMSSTALVDEVAPERHARIAHRRFRKGDLRPWGGREFFVILELN